RFWVGVVPGFAHAVDVAAGPRQPTDEPGRDRIARAGDDDRYVFDCLFGGERGGIAEGDDDVDVGGLELGHETVEPLWTRVGGSLHDNEILAVGETARGQIGEKSLAALVRRAHRGAVWKQP